MLSKHDLWNNLLNEYKNQGTLVEGLSISSLKTCNIVLRRPVKYNPDKRDFVLTENALSTFDKQNKQKDPMVDFDAQSDISKSES